MITFRVSTDVKADRQVLLTLPPEVPTGKAELVVSVTAPRTPAEKQPGTSLPNGAQPRARRAAKKHARYPLRGSVVRYEQPTDPVAEADWEALG